ncbi:uncharacterized protein LOC117575971 [Drosophila albomicans]|uniref:Uncharacterized protein LOC117575971 n=1 Tax=Drosophila albomicans TaxID=7291 RepID=A0A6P8XIK6_DROAB|nr:uncharacterized protein LOC117575971 [Drosophila albomicans]
MALPSTKATTATTTHAVVQAIETYIQNQNLLGEIAELDELLNDVIDLHKDNELALKRVVQCIYNLLQTNNKHNVKFGAKVFHKLIAIVVANNKSFGRQLVANVLICVQIYARKFPRIDGKFLLQQLWALSLSNERQPNAAQILVYLFDDFVRQLGVECVCCCNELQLVIKGLLQSEGREFRKAAYFLMRKLNNFSSDVKALDTLICTEQQWSSYVTIMESLEEQQSHLMLPTLATLMPRITCRSKSNLDNEWITWVRILYARLLQDNNILVLRWTVEYFLTHFGASQLCQVNLLPEFLAATNRTQLYNVECYIVPTFKINNFVPQEEMYVFLRALATVPWHSVPLLFWLNHITPQSGTISKKILFKLSSRVRTLRNTKLRRIANNRVFEIFEETINSLTLRDYLVFIETIFNVNDGYYRDHERLIIKLQNCESIDEDILLSKRSYEIIVDDSHINLLVPELIRHLDRLPKKLHGWWRLFPLFHLNHLDPSVQKMCWNFYRTQYDVKSDILQKGSDLENVQEHLICQLDCQTKEEKSFVKEKCVDWFVEANLQCWSQIQELHLKPLELLERGTRATFVWLAQLLNDTDTPVEDNENIFNALLNMLQKYKNSEYAVKALLNYASKHMNDVDIQKLAEKILNYRCQHTSKALLANVKTLGVSSVVEGILIGDISTGDARIEAAYTDSIVQNPFDEIVIRDQYIWFGMQQPDEEVNAISDQLLLVNKQLTEKKPRYFENCREHRLKMRIARALLLMQGHINWSQELWNTLLAPCDQLNISYMYECLVATLLPSLQYLLEQIQQIEQLKPTQQVSIISVIHLYCLHNWKNLQTDDLEKISSFLLPHTMGAHFQTRLLAQLVLHKIAVKCKTSGIHVPNIEVLRSGIAMTLGSKLTKFEQETRIILSDVMLHPATSADLILYMTNAPFDEYDKTINIPDNIKINIDAYRKTVITRKNPLTVAHQLPMEMTNLNVQRKANPVNDIFNTNENITKEATPAEQNLIVVASLIDKLPNLGGLARTSEVLGVTTLVVGSKSIVDKTDFTNLSMTAEKSLNILEVKPDNLSEFLINKQSMGYKIVGAEQTAHSVSFVDFKFPEKCILLLGHEKHGISVDLIALLDFAVEIPQFGVVRSLNVHVTGSLFIWEYCKQHLNK